MADNVPYVEDPAVSIAADEIGGIKFQRLKLIHGDDGLNAGDVSDTNGLPVRVMSSALPAGAATNAKLDSVITALVNLLNELDTKASLTDTQPVSAAALPLPAGAASEATLALVKAKTDNLDVALSTRLKAADTLAAVTNLAQLGGQAVAMGTGTRSAGTLRVTVATDDVVPVTNANLDVALSTRLKPADTLAAVTALGSITGALPAGTNNIGDVDVLTLPAVVGGKTNNNAAPGATNVGALIAIANAALASYTEGNLVLPSIDLRGVLRCIDTAEDCLGEYEWQGISGGYTGLAANTPLWSLRWGDATRFCRILRVEVMVFTSTAATVASITERQLIIARSFTASDTGGTAATLTGNNQKLRTSDGTSLVTDMRIGAPITAGTRTLDAAPIASAMGWSGLLSTGVVIGAYGSSPVGAARSTEGGGQFQTLYDEKSPGARKIVLAQNEGLVVRIGAVMPTTAVQQTLVKIKWRETNKAN